jgi:hypothetical protein
MYRYGVYHSVYDSFSYVEQQVDPDFKYHALQAFDSTSLKRALREP